MRRSADEIGATSISFRRKCLAIRHRSLTEFFPPIESARHESNRAHGSLERAHARENDEDTTEPWTCLQTTRSVSVEFWNRTATLARMGFAVERHVDHPDLAQRRGGPSQFAAQRSQQSETT